MSAAVGVDAAALLACDPLGLGGAIVRGDAQAWLAALRANLPDGAPFRRLPANADREALLGGLDLPATLAAGKTVLRRGLFAEVAGGVLVVPGAERLTAERAGLIAAAMEPAPAFALVLLDESRDGEPGLPAILAERVAFRLDVRLGGDFPPSPAAADARAVSAAVGDIEALCAIAQALGVESLRAEQFALAAARASASLHGRHAIAPEDLDIAVALVLAPRATRIPADPEASAQEAPAQAPETALGDAENASEGPDSAQGDARFEALLAAAKAALPQALLAGLATSVNAKKPNDGRGLEAKRGQGRGRPQPPRPGTPGRDGRLALMATLRAAAPFQRLRGRVMQAPLRLRASDFRVQRRGLRPGELIVFAVDASGSAAAQRLAEAKGAVELLLAQAYVKRTEVALVAFRDRMGQAILPPTRSLARAKRCLADLVGGGATPLAAGLEAAARLAQAAQQRGLAPVLVVLSDGRANVALNGAIDREAAQDDALKLAKHIKIMGLKSAFVDVSPRPRAEGKKLAQAMGARYAPLPYADSARLRDLASP